MDTDKMPDGDSRPTPVPARAELQDCAREALATIEQFRQGSIDGARCCRVLVNDENLREIVPIRLLVDLIGAESQFPADPDEARAARMTPEELAELRAERDELLAEEHDSILAACTALAAHLEEWRRDHPIPPPRA